METYSEELVRLEASLPESLKASGMRVAVVELGPTDKAWNPSRNDQLLRGPARVTYVFWPDGLVDFVVHELTA